jgi:hypothetical protein
MIEWAYADKWGAALLLAAKRQQVAPSSNHSVEFVVFGEPFCALAEQLSDST